MYVLCCFKDNAVSLEKLLIFFTGAQSYPPLGYGSATLQFNSDYEYPTASTCAIELTLPTKYRIYEEFKQVMNIALLYNGGFGRV